MATFFVGQRVRLVRPRKPCHQGLEGRIAEMGFWPKGSPARDSCTGTICDADCVVNFDRDGLMYCNTHRLEPIVPEGMQPVSWSECLWQPEGVAA